MGLLLGDELPDLTVPTTAGVMKLHDFAAGSWLMVCSHPATWTPVCTTELGRLAQLQSEFDKRGVKVMGISCDRVEDDAEWIKDIETWMAGSGGCKVTFPIIGDTDRSVAKAFGMIQTEHPSDSAGMPMTVRNVFIFGPDKKLKLTITYPASCGRNFDEIIRTIDSLQTTTGKSVATPVDWKVGDACIILPSVSDEAAAEKFPQGWKTADLPSGKKYLRIVEMPKE
ncbi:Peroxiredoxin-6 [Porphyridium purpureum]|uniref:Peroxiredoxin-6 n=1 Tax=Porphyridium purpureum TaxID=35688 RepID=A0A5J4YKH5_PORPP|nr:Peroxiredoxin-6 [Porphyridium purpureum]|eukprot:POR0917..scf244_11